MYELKEPGGKSVRLSSGAAGEALEKLGVKSGAVAFPHGVFSGLLCAHADCAVADG